MADSTLDVSGEEPPSTGLGHGTRALGPSDSSDSGSDVVGGPGTAGGLSDENARSAPRGTQRTAGADLGDADLDSDTDSAGTGERASAGRDTRVDRDLQPVRETVDDALGDFDERVDERSSDNAADDEADVDDGAT